MNLKTSVAWNRRESRRLLFIPLAVALLGLLFFTLSANVQAQSQLNPQQTTGTLSTAYIKVTFPIRDALWEKGKTYTVRWESKGVMGNVKIRLVNNNGRAFDLAANVANSGSFNCLVPANFVDGAYRIQVMKIDGSVKGQSGVTITIGVPKTTYAKVTGQAEQGKTAAPGKAMAKTGAAGTVGAAGVSSTGGTHGTGATAAAGTAATASSSGRGSATAASMTHKNFQVVRVPDAELRKAKLLTPIANASAANKQSQATIGQQIEVISPKNGDEWEAEKEYLIQWKSAHITGDVKIRLEGSLYPGETRNEEYTIVERTGNTGFYHFQVPKNCLLRHNGYRVRVMTLDGRVSGYSAGAFSVYTQNIDLECKIMDMKHVDEETYYVVYGEEHEWLEFNVWMKNWGIQGPITIPDVLVQIIKEPEGKVAIQQEWGFSGIYPRYWYSPSDPLRFDMCDSRVWIDWNPRVNLQDGSYRIEVTLDPQNLLRENEELRQNNAHKAVREWIIKRNMK